MADGTIFDTVTMLQIDFIAVRMAIEIDPDVPPLTLFTDELIGDAIAEHFADEPDWTDELRPAAIAAYRAAQGLQALARDMAFSLLGGVMSGWTDARGPR